MPNLFLLCRGQMCRIELVACCVWTITGVERDHLRDPPSVAVEGFAGGWVFANIVAALPVEVDGPDWDHLGLRHHG